MILKRKPTGHNSSEISKINGIFTSLVHFRENQETDFIIGHQNQLDKLERIMDATN